LLPILTPPSAKVLGAGASPPIAWALVGPLLDTQLTLFIIPVAYILLTRDRKAAVSASQPFRAQPEVTISTTALTKLRQSDIDVLSSSRRTCLI
jgi:hypothetical protein